MEGTSTPNNKDQMHNLPPEKAFVYWIPSIGVAIGMVLALLYSFWKFHKRKMITRQIQIEYMEVNFAAKRPRIGAIRCNTHGAKLDDLMASFNTPRFPHLPPYVKQSSKSRRPRRYDTLFEENEQTQDKIKQYTKYSIQYSTDKTNGENGKELNPYYEQSCKVESSPRPRKKTSSKRKKKKRSLLSIYGSSQARNNVELTTSSSPRRLPVIENHLWSGYSPNLYYNNERQIPSFYYTMNHVPRQEEKTSSNAHSKEFRESKHIHTVERRSESRHRPKEERVFWILAEDIPQSVV